MSKSTNGLRKVGLASLAVTLTLGAGLAGAGVANADADFEFTRIAGDNRYETAATVADTYATATTDEVILVNGEAGYYADALTANYLSGMRKAPILLTRDEFMPAATKTALADLDPAKVTIVGGEGVVPADQADWLESEGYTVERFAGANRFETNVEVIEAGGATTEDTGIVATGFDFADALGAGPAVYQGRPLGLAKSDDIDDAIVDALDASGVTKIVVLGGESVVGQEVVDELEDAGFTVTRVDGADRSETSTEFADYAIKNFGFTNKAADVASGYTLGSGADALAGGPLTGERNRPMLITKNLDNPGDLVDWLKANAATLEEGVIYGGYGAVTASAEDRMEAAARSVSSNQDFTVTPAEAATNTVSDASGADADRGLRQYSVSGLDNATTYDVALFDAADVTVDANGVVTFADDDKNNQADWTANADPTTGAIIEVVNGAGNAGGDNHLQTKPVNGTISFSIDSQTADSVVPVIFVDEGLTGGDQLALDANDAPTEAFAIGGQKTWVPEEAASGTVGADDLIESVDKSADQIVAAGGVYNYDTNDTFYITGNGDDVRDPEEQVTYAEFEAQLSAGDSVSAGTIYQRNPDFSSSFLLDDDAPGVTDVAVNTVTEDSVELTVTPPANFDSDDTITLSRAASTDGGTLPADCTDDTFGTAADIATLTQADDEDTATGGIQYTDTVPAADCYEYSATSMIDGEESAAGATDVTPAPTTTDTTAPDMTGATPNDINNGVGSTNQVIVTFNEAVTTVDAALLSVSPTLQPGLVIDVTNAAQRNESGTTWTLTLSQSLDDAGTDIEYTISSEEGAYADSEGNETAAKPIDATFSY